jgi:hypothetical protein
MWSALSKPTWSVTLLCTSKLHPWHHASVCAVLCIAVLCCALLLCCIYVQLRPKLAESVLERTKLLKWLLSRIRVKGSDSNKQYASEVLSILMQVRSHCHVLSLLRMPT